MVVKVTSQHEVRVEVIPYATFSVIELYQSRMVSDGTFVDNLVRISCQDMKEINDMIESEVKKDGETK